MGERIMTDLFCNPTEIVCVMIQTLTTDVTGHIFLTLMLFIIAEMLIAALFKLPIEMSVILVLPTLIVFSAYISTFTTILGAALIWIGVIFAKNFFIQ